MILFEEIRKNRLYLKVIKKKNALFPRQPTTNTNSQIILSHSTYYAKKCTKNFAPAIHKRYNIMLMKANNAQSMKVPAIRLPVCSPLFL